MSDYIWKVFEGGFFNYYKIPNNKENIMADVKPEYFIGMNNVLKF